MKPDETNETEQGIVISAAKRASKQPALFIGERVAAYDTTTGKRIWAGFVDAVAAKDYAIRRANEIKWYPKCQCVRVESETVH